VVRRVGRCAAFGRPDLCALAVEAAGRLRSPREVVLAWVDGFNRRDTLAAAAPYHDDAVNTEVTAGRPTVRRQAVLEELLEFFRGLPDNYTRPVIVFEDGEWAVRESSGEVLGGASFARLPANGRSFTLQGCGFVQVIAGKITFQRGSWDKAG